MPGVHPDSPMLSAMAAAELVFDSGVLNDGALCEFQGWRAAAERRGHSVLAWRADWLQARQADVDASAGADELDDSSVGQCLVHLQKSRPGTWHDLSQAWRLLPEGGRLLLYGGNELGVVSAVKRLARELAQRPRIVANRSHARIALFRKDRGPGPLSPRASHIDLPGPTGRRHPLRVEPGAFGARRLDAGSEILLAELARQPEPQHVLDLGCGVGPLGLWTLLRWSATRAVLLDGDARAVRSANHNARALGLAQRCRIEWWDAREPCPTRNCDLVLLNPPFHTGKAVDLAPARALFRQLAAALAAGGRALVVANRTLPYESDLAGLGRLQTLRAERGYKLLALRRRVGARPSGRP